MKVCNILTFAYMTALLWSMSFAQAPDTSWTRRIGGSLDDYGSDVHQTPDGGYIIFASTNSFGSGDSDFWLIKTDANGDTTWTRTYGGPYTEHVRTGLVTHDSGYIAVGYRWIDEPTSLDAYVVRTDENGDSLWAMIYGLPNRDVASSVCQTSDGGFVIAGDQWVGYQDTDIRLFKVDAQGTLQWTKRYGGSTYEYCYFHTMSPTADNGFIITAFTYSFGAVAGDVYCIKTDSSGDSCWTRTYGGDDSDLGNAVIQVQSGDYVVAANSNSFGPQSDYYLIKIDEVGDTIWTRTYSGGIESIPNSISETNDGDYVIAGYSCRFTYNNQDVFILKVKPNGDLIWSTALGDSSYNELCVTLRQTGDGGYIAVGGAEAANGWDVYLIKFDQDTLGIFDNNGGTIHGLLLQASPNPFREKTHITWHGPDRVSGTVSECTQLKVTDVCGRTVKTFNVEEASSSAITWTGVDDMNRNLPSGVYYINLQSGTQTITHQLVLLR